MMDLDRIEARARLEMSAAKVPGEPLSVDGRRHGGQSSSEALLKKSEEQIDLQAPLVNLVNDGEVEIG